MADSKISLLTAYTNPDPVNDVLPIVDTTNTTTKKISRNNLLGITSAPVGKDDTQTLTAKTLTAPTINGATLSGTLSGTYTIGGTPTFPASVVTLTGSQTLTNKVLTSPTINAPTITNASITADALTGFSSANSGTIYGMVITNSVISNSALPLGTVVQMVDSLTSAVATGTTLIPYDNTIPQNTEGDQYMTLAITPKSTTNTLVIQVNVYVSSSVVNNMTAALFQDSTANALAAITSVNAVTTGAITIPLYYVMIAGTTSSITFKVRSGGNLAGTTTFNGSAGAQSFSTASKSSIIIWEYKS